MAALLAVSAKLKVSKLRRQTFETGIPLVLLGGPEDRHRELPTLRDLGRSGFDRDASR